MLLLTPSWYAMPQSDWPSNLYLPGFALAPEISLDAELTAFIARRGAPIVFTPGTGVSDTTGFFHKAAAVARASRYPALFLSKHIPKHLRDMPDVLCRDFLPLGGLLRCAAAIIHHGGIGTIGEALRAGCPQLVVPDRFDQPDNAMRVARLGLGAAVMSADYSAREVADLLNRMMDSSHVRLQLATARGLVEAEDGVENAVRIVEHVLGDRRSRSIRPAAEVVSGRSCPTR
ncbi:MAG: nucleotide disphospho-sugar-binding domain-containing protein [Sphingomonas bacterium]